MTRPANRRLCKREDGSALTEAAIMFPIMILILWWSSAMTDIMVLKIKGMEAARFALWETTVFRTQPQIAADLKARFRDLRSPASINNAGTGLLMYPQSANITWDAEVNTRAGKVGMGGTYKPPPTDSWLQKFINTVLSFISRAVNTVAENQRFNVYGYAEARVGLTRASSTGSQILTGGNLVGPFGKGQLDKTPNMRNFSLVTPLASERPMRLVFDTWKAWPKPTAFTLNGAPTNTDALPTDTYGTVDKQVSAQVEKMTFFGLTRLSWFNKIRGALSKLTTGGLSKAVFGGELPDLFSSNPLDAPGNRKSRARPISILPVEQPAESWAVKSPVGKTHRIGDEGGTGASPMVPNDQQELTDGTDRSRYTVPYRINSVYWTDEGGTNRKNGSHGTKIAKPKATIVSTNDYVKSFACRGHYFSGGITSQLNDPTKRYKPSCR